MSAVLEKDTKPGSTVVVADTPYSKREAAPVPTPVQDQTPMHMLSVAVRNGMDVATIKDLMALQERWDANEARKAFNGAFADFKSEAVKIIKRTEVKDGPLKGKFHANLFDVVDATTPPLSKHGLTISWKLTKDDPAWMEVTCTLRHVGGHSESVSMGGAPDTGPGRNAIQARGSAKSYLERYTATAILGLAAQDADNDGKGGKDNKLPEYQYQAFVKKITDCTTEEKALKAWREGLAECEKLKDSDSAKALRIVLRDHRAFIAKANKAA